MTALDCMSSFQAKATLISLLQHRHSLQSQTIAILTEMALVTTGATDEETQGNVEVKSSQGGSESMSNSLNNPLSPINSPVRARESRYEQVVYETKPQRLV